MKNTLVKSLLVATLCCSLVYAGTPRTSSVRVLSPEEAQQINGGIWPWVAACLTVETLYVVGSVCSIGSAGWIVIQETWDSGSSGNQSGGTYTDPTTIRQAVQSNQTSCVMTDTVEEVYESFLN